MRISAFRLRTRSLRAALSLGLLAIALSVSGARPPLGDGDSFEPPGLGDLPAGVPEPQEPAGPAPEDPAAPAPPASAPIALTASPSRPPAAYASGHVVAEFAANLADWQRRQIAHAAGGTTFKSLATGRLVRVGLAEGDSAQALASRLSGQPGVLLAERDPIAWSDALEVRQAGNGAKRGFSDPFFSAQWELSRIRLPEARDINPTDGEGVIVAVLDSGVAFGDGTRYPTRRGVDLGGVRFRPGLDLVGGGQPIDRGVRLSPSSPLLFGHGTFVASQIAAAVDNGIGGASVAPRVTILPVRVIATDNFGLFSDVAAGIDFAVAQGAKVINMSLGGSSGAGFLEAAIERAHRAGVVLVASAGNSGDDPNPPSDVGFPARYPQVIAVGATTFDEQRAPYSNRGAGLDLAAPAGASSQRVVADGQRDAALAPSFVVAPATGLESYGLFWSTGTSFAAPQVAGAAALLLALGIDDPELVRALLVDNAVDRGPRGRDDELGAGRLDVRNAHRGVGFSF